MFHRAWVIVCVMCGLSLAAEVSLPRFPSISPDGSTIVFSWRGDLWRVGSAGGQATRLTAHPLNDLQSAFSRDGKRLAFASDRNGGMNLFMMNADGTGLRTITEIDRILSLVGFAVDEQGREILTFSATIEPEPLSAPRPMSIATGGGEFQRLIGAHGSFPSVSPDGSKILFNRGYSSWSRRNYRGADNRDIWLFDRKARSYTRLTKWEGADGRARWIDNDSFVFTSDRQDNSVNLYRLKLGEEEAKAVRLTNFQGNDVEDFDVAADGKSLVFAMWNHLYTLELAKAGAVPVVLKITADEDEQDRIQLRDIGKSVSEAVLSPDNKTMAYIAYGDVYVRGVESRSPTRRVTQSAARERDIAWAPDGTVLYFVSDESGREGVYTARPKLTRGEIKKQFDDKPASRPATQPSEASRWPDAIAFAVEPMILNGTLSITDPSPSQDGKHLAYRRGRGQIAVRELADGAERILVDGWSTQVGWRWSPDSRHIAYYTEDANHNLDVWIVAADGSTAAVNVSKHPANDHSPRWSADGKVLAFLSERINREYDVWAVFLDKDLEAMTPQELAQYYKGAAADAKKREPVKAATRPATRSSTRRATRPAKHLDLDDAYLRLRRITTLAGEEGDLELSPGGERVIFAASVAGERALYIADTDGGAPRKIAANAGVQHLSLAGDQAVLVQDGRAALLKIPTGETEFVDIAEKIVIDLPLAARQKFLEASRIVGDNFHDPKLNGLDWPALTRRYLKLAEETRTADEFDHVAARFVGELNGSHLGINSPDPVSPHYRPIGRLGITRTRTADGYRVDSVLADGPAGKGSMKLHVGDEVVAIDLQPFAALETLDSKLAGKAGKEVIVTVRRKDGEAAKEINLLLTPMPYERWSDLVYKQWRLETAKKVSEWSGGKLGYIHIQGMNQDSLDLFERDLYAAADGRKGLIIDVRNNGGGWTTDRLLASIMAPDHAYTIARGMPEGMRGYPNDRLFIARATMPMNLLCNERSISNAEIISHAFKTLKRGTLVGQRTNGGVISTGGTTLPDGTSVRIPFRSWYTREGAPQENNGAVPDILVEPTPENEERGNDAQLKAAVEDLLKRL